MLDVRVRERELSRIRARLAARNDRNASLIREYADRIRQDVGPARQCRVISTLMYVTTVLTKDADTWTRADIERFARHTRDLRPNTIVAYNAILRGFVTYLHDPNRFPKGPVPPSVSWLRGHVRRRDRSRLQRHELLTPEEVERAIQLCGRTRDRAFLSVLWETGARICEIGNLERQHVTPEGEGYLLDLAGKTGRRSVLVIKSAPHLRSWLRVHPKPLPTAPLWWGRFGALGYGYLRGMVITALRRAGVTRRVYPHLLRHSRATHVLATGVMTETQAKRYFGWSPDSMMLSTYAHLTDQDANNAILRENHRSLGRIRRRLQEQQARLTTLRRRAIAWVKQVRRRVKQDERSHEIGED